MFFQFHEKKFVLSPPLLKRNNYNYKKNPYFLISEKGSQDQQESTKKKEKVTTKTKDQVDETIKAKGQEQQPSEKDEKKSKKSDVNKTPQKETETKDAKKSPPEKTNVRALIIYFFDGRPLSRHKKGVFIQQVS